MRIGCVFVENVSLDIIWYWMIILEDGTLLTFGLTYYGIDGL